MPLRATTTTLAEILQWRGYVTGAAVSRSEATAGLWRGFDLFNPSLRIPLILSFPGFLPAGERVSGWVTSLDLYPTILDLAQLTFPPGLQGRSVLPLVRQSKDQIHERIFFQNDQHLMAISNRRLKLIDYPAQEDRPAHFQLFDLLRDPGETADRFPESGARIAPFKAELSSFRTRTIAWQQATTSKRGGAEAATDEGLSEAARENLCAMGYLTKGCPEP